jgi:hypothetical protein
VCFGVSGKESEAPGGPARGGRLGQALVSQRLFTCDGTRAGTTVRSNGTFSTGTPAHERVKTSRTARRPKPGGRSYRPPSTAIRGCETMTDLLFQPSPARGPNDYEVIADDWIVGRIVLSMLHRPRGHGCGRWITSSIKAASGHTATKPRGRPPCRRSRGAGIATDHDTERRGNEAGGGARPRLRAPASRVREERG